MTPRETPLKKDLGTSLLREHVLRSSFERQIVPQFVASCPGRSSWSTSVLAPLQAPRTPQLTRRPDVRRHHACAPPALACDGRRASCARSAFVTWVERSTKYGRAQLSSSNFHLRATSNDAEFPHAHRVLAAQIGLCNGFLAYIFSLCHCSELNFVLKHPIEHIWSL